MQTTTARIEVFRPGTFTSMEGRSLTYSAADLKAMADAYDYDTAPAPVVVGHPSTDAPAFAWAKSFDFDATSGRLYATVGEINPAFAEEVKKGSYKKVSLQLFAPEQPANPTPGTWYPKHIGFLGGAAPAVSGLKNVAFSASEGSVTFAASFGERGFEETASLLRTMRDFLIEKFGMEAADKALPAYRIEWLSEAVIEPPKQPSFAAPVPSDPKTTPASFAERDELVKLRREIAAGKVDKLIDAGKVLPVFKDEILSFAASLDETATVSFADGKEVPSRDWFMSYLERQPKQVSFGAFNLGPDPETKTTAIPTPEGFAVDQTNTAMYHRIREIARDKGVSFSEAIDIAQGK